MKLALLGYGRMGQEIAAVARQRGHDIVAIIDPQAADATATSVTAASLADADVVIDFTSPEAVVDNIRAIAAAGRNMVVGTTGWSGSMTDVQDVVRKAGIGFIHSANFSIGVNAFFRMVAAAARLMDRLDMYDVFAYELHHNQKVDSPSGTAKALETVLLDVISRKKRVVEDRLDRRIAPEELHVASIRAGSIPGTHVVGFDSEADTIELKHAARSRKGFATGAVLAAEWLAGKKGFFTMDDFVEALFG